MPEGLSSLGSNYDILLLLVIEAPREQATMYNTHKTFNCRLHVSVIVPIVFIQLESTTLFH